MLKTTQSDVLIRIWEFDFIETAVTLYPVMLPKYNTLSSPKFPLRSPSAHPDYQPKILYDTSKVLLLVTLYQFYGNYSCVSHHRLCWVFGHSFPTTSLPSDPTTVQSRPIRQTSNSPSTSDSLYLTFDPLHRTRTLRSMNAPVLSF